MDKLRHMEIFKAVVETGQFTRAANSLSLSKSAVSHAVSALEAHLGSQLINRNNRSLQLTDAGENYYQNCRRVLADIGAIEDEIRHEELTVRGLIHVTAPITYGVSVLSPIFADFMRSNPEVELNISLSESNMDLVQAGLDVAIRIGVLPDSAMIARRLSQTRQMLCATADFLKRNNAINKPEDLNNVSCFRYRWTPKWYLSKEGKTTAIQPKGKVISDSGEALLQMAIGGHGVCYLPDFICGDALKERRLVRVLPDYDGQMIPVHAVFPPHRHRSMRVQRIVDYLANSLHKSEMSS
jgi:DNA-binding transcriptional LysR family regulator